MYQQGTVDRFLSFFWAPVTAPFCGFWQVSRNINVGKGICWMKAAGDARHPNDIRAGCWLEGDGAVWVAAPAVSVVLEGKARTHGAHGDSHLLRHCALLMCDCVLLPFNCSGRRSG